MQDLSLRERMFQAQQSQWDQDYTLRYRQIGLQEEQQKLNEKVQNSNMEVQRRASVDFEADSYAAPVFASIAGELQSLSGDPSAILNYQPDLTELDKLDPDIARRAKSKVLVQFQPYRDQLLAASDELKEASATGQALLKGAPYLNTVENYGTGASLRAKQIGRKILRRQELTPDEEQLAIDYYDVIARESSKRDPKLIETKTKLSGQLVVENLKSAVAEYQAASKTYNDTLNNMTATDSAKKSAQEELELAKANLRSAKLMAGIKQNIFEEGSEPEQVETQAEEPKYITKYIVDNTVGKLCDEKKAELNIIDEEYAKGRTNRKKETLKKLDENLQTYRNWLLDITICDPACGSGAFLNQALEYLMEEHRYIDELESQLLGAGFTFPGVENHILENNIFGVDINEESIEIAKLSLWLRTAQRGRKLTSLNNNIKCGNSLIDDPEVAGEKAFNWHQELPTVFDKGGCIS